VLATHKTHAARRWVTDLISLTFLLSAFYLIWLGSHPLFTPDEGRYCEVAREMILTQDYITPRLNGVAFLDKPILYYWLQVSAIKVFGLKEWALRFWPAVMGILGGVSTYIAGRILFNRRTGILAAVILATNPLYYGAAHYANLDLEVAVLISNTLLFSIIALQSTRPRQRTVFLFLAYIFAALAALTKGLIGLAFPTLIIGAWIIILNHWRILGKMRLGSGALIFTCITAPWYFLAQHANPQFFHFFFATQQVARFLTTADFNNPSVVWFYVPVVLAGFLPWSLLLFQAFTQQLKSIWHERKQHQTEVFLLLWCVIIFIFFSIPKSKTVGYILPIFPALALIVGNYLSIYWDKPKTKGILIAIISFFVLCVVIIASCLIVPHVKAIEIVPSMNFYLNVTALLFGFSGMMASYLLYKNHLPKLFYCFVFVAFSFLLTLLASASAINQKTIKPLALQLRPFLTAQDEIVTFYRYYQDLPIYLERCITIVADWNAADIPHNDNWLRELWFGMPFQNTTAWLIQEPVFWQRWHSNRRLFVFMNAHDYENFNKKAHYKAYKLSEHNDVALIANHQTHIFAQEYT
jgi:4-amino-4-deoxy-L-arabinose transferase-like glycosyltransferase